LLAGKWEALSEEAVATTRRPHLNSRISRAQGLQLIERAQTADWRLVAAETELSMVNPLVDHSTFAHAVDLYSHFLDPKLPRVSRGKVHKILYVMRPQFFPIVDSRLATLYRKPARVWARKLADAGLSRGFAGPSYWAAIRDDLLQNATVIGNIRTAINGIDEGIHTETLAHLSDVRILDMLAWSIDSDGC
jgi:hypothetical protein